MRSYNRRYPHRDEKTRPYAPERPETTKSRGMNDSPWPMPRVAKMRHAVVGRVHKTPPNHLPDISLSTPNPHAGVGGQRDGPSYVRVAKIYLEALRLENHKTNDRRSFRGHPDAGVPSTEAVNGFLVPFGARVPRKLRRAISVRLAYE